MVQLIKTSDKKLAPHSLPMKKKRFDIGDIILFNRSWGVDAYNPALGMVKTVNIDSRLYHSYTLDRDAFEACYSILGSYCTVHMINSEKYEKVTKI